MDTSERRGEDVGGVPELQQPLPTRSRVQRYVVPRPHPREVRVMSEVELYDTALTIASIRLAAMLSDGSAEGPTQGEVLVELFAEARLHVAS